MVEVIYTVAELMALAARTAPKAKGEDCLVMAVLKGDQLEQLAGAMIEHASKTGQKVFELNGGNVRRSAAVLLIGIKNPQKAGLDCGACGAPRCADLENFRSVAEFAGPICAWRLVDLGIAIGSAVKTASIHNVDNRIMYTIGAVARQMGLIDAELAVGIPLSATGKSIYFDRFDPIVGRQ